MCTDSRAFLSKDGVLIKHPHRPHTHTHKGYFFWTRSWWGSSKSQSTRINRSLLQHFRRLLPYRCHLDDAVSCAHDRHHRSDGIIDTLPTIARSSPRRQRPRLKGKKAHNTTAPPHRYLSPFDSHSLVCSNKSSIDQPIRSVGRVSFTLAGWGLAW